MTLIYYLSFFSKHALCETIDYRINNNISKTITEEPSSGGASLKISICELQSAIPSYPGCIDNFF